MMNDVLAPITMAGASAILIEWLKKQHWFPFAQFDAFWLNSFTALITSLISSGVLVYTYSANGDFQLSGNIYAIGSAVYTIAQQYVLQHVIYLAGVKPNSVAQATESKGE